MHQDRYINFINQTIGITHIVGDNMFFLNTFLDLVQVIYDYIDKETNNEGKLQQQLLEARLKFEMDEITEEEYEEIESFLLQRINGIRQQKFDVEEDEE